ncbi:hypothetical protein [Thioclava sp. GXIMD4216]|uniref:hypothetical protein n=1 Tax=Thioclava sp. GXIMD4216 TaxID=3131929 RepID=UPI0030D3AB2B
MAVRSLIGLSPLNQKSAHGAIKNPPVRQDFSQQDFARKARWQKKNRKVSLAV